MKIFILLMTLAYSLLSSPIPKTIDELLQAKDISVQKPNKYDPFKRAKPLIIKKKEKNIVVTKVSKLEVVAIMNKKAFIDRKWVQKNDFVRGMKIIKITPLAVYIKNKNKTIVLQLQKGKKLLIIQPKDKN